MRLGVVILPEQRWPAARETWQRAEALGFDHAWTYDHLAWRTLRDGPWFAAIPTLTAAATVTTTLRLGTLVASPNVRHPVTFAKDLVALDDISAGRAVAGIGSGGTGWDATMMTDRVLTPGQRAERFREFVEVVDLLLREPAASYRGSHYLAQDARTYPGCVQQPRPPLAVAATGPRGMRLAAELADTWVTTGDPTGPGPLPAREGVAVVRDQMQGLDAACAATGRDPASLGRLVLTGTLLDGGLTSVRSFTDTVSAYADAGVTDLVVHWPRSGPPYEADAATFEQAIAAVTGC